MESPVLSRQARARMGRNNNNENTKRYLILGICMGHDKGMKTLVLFPPPSGVIIGTWTLGLPFSITYFCRIHRTMTDSNSRTTTNRNRIDPLLSHEGDWSGSVDEGSISQKFKKSIYLHCKVMYTHIFIPRGSTTGGWMMSAGPIDQETLITWAF